jgi:hypothetical protein
MPKDDSADLSEKISGDIAVKPPRAARGKPFRKGVSGNPGGRPASAAEFRSSSRAAAATFLGQLVFLAEAGKLDFDQLRAALADAAGRGGYLTDAQAAELEATRLAALGSILSGAHLSDEARTKIIEDFQRRRALAEVDTS